MSNVYSVSHINKYIKNMFLNDFFLNNITIKGEISDCKYHSSGHIYFTLKDNESAINAVMFKSNRAGIDFKLQKGQQVIINGEIKTYDVNGTYQLYAKHIELDGKGDLYKKFEELKNKLEDMGVFAGEYKKEIPKYATKIGVVTSKTGSVIQDIINVSKRRNPYVDIILYPALVQGEYAKESIIKGIRTLDMLDLDIIIVGRGGGSIEDLWAFNEEDVAMAVFNCYTPIISAVGHETDFTICDFAADLRVPTPSAAAEVAVFEYGKFLELLNNYKYTLSILENRLIKNNINKIKNYEMNLKLLSPQNKLMLKKQRLDEIYNLINSRMNSNLIHNKNNLSMLAKHLNSLSPLNKISNGYGFITDNNSNILTSVLDVKVDDEINIALKDGKITTKAMKVGKYNE